MKRKRKGSPNIKKYKSHKLRKETLLFKIQKFFQTNNEEAFNAVDIKLKLGITNKKDEVKDVLFKLREKGIIDAKKEGTYQLNKNFKENKTVLKTTKSKGYIGKVDLTKTGAAYIIIDEMDDDVYVRASDTEGAMNGDKVRVIVRNRGGKRPEGKIVKIIERSLDKIMGIFRIYNNNGIVYNLNSRQSIDVYVDPKDYGEAKDGDVVITKVKTWGTGQNKSIWGTIENILNDNTENDIVMKSILVENGFDLEFPKEVIEEVRNISGEIEENEIAKRRDLREITTFTIDPLTAKDFDDALSVEYKEDNIIEIGIHIADVSHYVKPRTALDKEAYSRSTSVYLVDRVLPMLPERLSNELCSLRPEEEKYTFSAIFTFNESNKIIKEWYGRTIIYSDRRFTYEEAQEVIESKEGDFAKEMILLDKLAKNIRKKRFNNGAIDFDSEEVYFKLDEEAVPIEVHVKERKDAHKLVEEFMLLANKGVASFMSNKSKGVEVPFVYRVHDLPNQDKLREFSMFAKEMGYTMNVDTPDQVVKSFNGLVKAAQKDEGLKLLLPLAIRTMAKAIYTTENIGHYGLGFENYTHFTSPIRRYSDVLVHRILYDNLEKVNRDSKPPLESMCNHISEQERNASKAERSSIKYKQVEYMSTKVGLVFDGVISGMIDKGIFVEIVGVGAEGLIPFSRFSDSFQVEESRLKAKGKNTGQLIKMGDHIKVKLIEVNLEMRQIEMEIFED